MGAIFISYRREDSEGHAGRLFEDLVARFGKESVFIDVTGIEPGRDFRKVIDAKVSGCGVLLAVIGNSWLKVNETTGARRIDDPSDFVRLETLSALKRDIPVVPVLVHGARMPSAEQLPHELADLAWRNAVELTHARWDSDVQVLMDALSPYVGGKTQAGAAAAAPPAARKPRLAALSAVLAVAVAVAVGIGVYATQHGSESEPGAEIVALVAQANGPDMAARKSATARLVREFGTSQAAIGLAVDQLSDKNFQALTKEGRVNLLLYLRDSDAGAWSEAQRAEARTALARIQQRLDSGTATLGPQVVDLIQRVKTKVGG